MLTITKQDGTTLEIEVDETSTLAVYGVSRGERGGKVGGGVRYSLSFADIEALQYTLPEPVVAPPERHVTRAELRRAAEREGSGAA